MGLFSGIKRFFTGERVFRPAATVVEIGSDWVKVATSHGTLSGVGIGRVRCLRLEEDSDAGTNTLARAFREVHGSKKNVITYLPRHMVTVRFLKVPSTNPAEVSQMVSLQAGRQTPYSREEVISAHRVLGTDAEGYATVLLVIARRSIISERLAMFHRAGIPVEKIGFSSEGIWSWFQVQAARDGRGQDTVALLDIDSSFSDILVFSKGKLVFTRSVLIGTDQLQSDPEKWQSELLKETRESLDRYKNENPTDTIALLYLAGSSQAVESARAVMSEGMRVATHAVQPFDNVSARGSLRKMQDPDLQEVSLSPLIGTVLKPDDTAIDLTPPEIHMEQVMEENRRQLTAVGLLGIVIVTLVCVLVFAGIYERSQIINQLENQVSVVQPLAEETSAMQRRIRFLNQREDARGTPLDMLAAMHQLTPADIQLTSLRIEAKNKVTFRGRGAARSDVRTYIDTLQDSPLLQKAKQIGATSQKTVGDESFVEFAAEAEFEAQRPRPEETEAAETEQVEP